MQDDLITTIDPIGNSSSEKELYAIVQRFISGEWQLPKFQRKFVWERDQIIGWIESIKSRSAIGVIVTYQLDGGGPIFIADGLQRLTATKLFLENPSEYGFDFGQEQAKKYCCNFDISVQHRMYKGHREAMVAFQKLNKGTSLTPLEFHQGYIALIPNGDLIIDNVPVAIRTIEKQYIYAPKKFGRKSEHALVRDAYSLFLQYISETDRKEFWSTTTSRLDNGDSTVESELAELIKDRKYTREQINGLVYNFERFLTEQMTAIGQALDEAGGHGIRIGRTMARWLMHLSIWRKNTNSSYQECYKLILDIFSYSLKTYGKINTRLDLPGTEPKRQVFLSMRSLESLALLCKAFGSSLYESRTPKRKKSIAAIGFQVSHKKPFVKFGDGETFLEPAPLNMSRGAQPAT